MHHQDRNGGGDLLITSTEQYSGMAVSPSRPHYQRHRRQRPLGVDGRETRPRSRSNRVRSVRAVSHPTPQTLRYLRERAEACERLAETATSPETRETMLYLASRWRALADEDEAKLHPSQRTGPRHPA